MPTPAPQDLNHEIGAINQTYLANAPMIGAGVVGNATGLTRGNFDAQAFYNANPGAQDQWNEWRAAGELQGWTPAQHAASFIGGMENDPRLNQYYTGGTGQTMGQSALEAQNYQNQLNTSAKQAALADYQNLGGQAVGAFNAANPGLAAATGAISGSVPGLNLGPQNVAPVAFTPIGGPAGQMGPMAGGFGPTPPPASFGGPLGQQGGYAAQSYSAPQFQAPTDNFSNAFMKSSGDYSSLALSPIQQMLQQQALGDLRLGGSLSGEDIRSAQQSARAGQSARGLAMGKNAVGEEILQTDALSRARLNERRGFASAVDANAFGQQNANRQLGLGYAGLANSSQQAAQQLGLGYNQLNGNLGLGYAQLGQNDRQFGAQLNQQNKQFGQSMGFNYAQLGQQGQQFNAANNLAAQQFNANLALQQQAGDRGYALNSTAMLGNLNQAAMAPLNAQGNGYGQANINYQLAAGAAPSYSSYLGYGQNVFDNNNNAAWANYNASQNRSAALTGSILGAVGQIGGTILGGPIGGAIGSGLGKIFSPSSSNVTGDQFIP